MILMKNTPEKLEKTSKEGYVCYFFPEYRDFNREYCFFKIKNKNIMYKSIVKTIQKCKNYNIGKVENENVPWKY